MMSRLRQLAFSGFGLSLGEKEALAVAVLRTWEEKALACDPDWGYWGCDSGGKDSGVIRELARLAGVKVTWHYNVTTIDPPEVCRFIREYHADTVWEHRPRDFFTVMAEDRGFPLRHLRWCCQEFKEGSGVGKVKITGVRWEESWRRRETWKEFQAFDPSRSHGDPLMSSWMCNPLVAWTAEDVWEFTRSRELPYCGLYDEGFERLGCVGCPMSGKKGIERDFARWPAIERGWRRAFERLWQRRGGTVLARGRNRGKAWPGIEGVSTWEGLYAWWKSGAGSRAAGEECELGLW